MTDNIKVTISLEQAGDGLSVMIPTDTKDGAVEKACKHILMHYCGWEETVIDDVLNRETLAFIKEKIDE